MDDRLVTAIFLAGAVLFGLFAVLEDAGLQKLALLAGVGLIVVTGVLFVWQLGTEAWRSFEDGA